MYIYVYVYVHIYIHILYMYYKYSMYILDGGVVVTQEILLCASYTRCCTAIYMYTNKHVDSTVQLTF